MVSPAPPPPAPSPGSRGEPSGSPSAGHGGAFGLPAAEWVQLRALLDEALALPAAERDGWLDAMAAGGAVSAGVLPHLRALVAQAGRDDFAERVDVLPPVFEDDGDSADGQAAGTLPGPGAPERIGPYRLIRELGSGGMASVWLAERTDMLQGRQVALKLPHGAWRRAGLAERMQREREILATLEHPHIARLYDAGVSDDGQPWLALEYVEGTRIDHWCTAQALPLPARLRLFLQVARAVAHAHARLVVHRDLKPANILVTGDGQVRLLDFGIAKLLDRGVAEATELTELHGRALTPDHASPEQLAGGAIGTASDIYSLGVVLFELLTGRQPYRLTGRTSRAALEDAVLHAEPRRASEAAPDPAEARRLRGDLDTIVGKALKKTPAERYATVDALADDIERYLQGRPVLAQPDTWAYRTRKFVQRHRLPVAAGAGVAAALVAGTAVALWQARVALDEARRAEQVRAFVVSMFEGVNPEQAGGARDVSAAQVLESAERRLAAMADAAPLVQAELRAALARSHLGLRRFDRAVAVVEPALALPELRDGPLLHPVRVDLTVIRARALRELQQLDAAEAALAPLLAHGDFAARHPAADAEARLVMGTVAHQRGRFDEASAAFAAVLDDTRGRAALDDLRIEAHELLSQARGMLRDKAGALDHARAAYEGRLAQHRDNPLHPQRMSTAQTYGTALMETGRFDDALPLLEQSLASARQVYGPTSGYVADYAARLGVLQGERGRFVEALALLEEAERAAEAARMPDSLPRAGQLRVLARAHLRLRHAAQALPRLDRALAIVRTLNNPGIERVLRADRAYAAALAAADPAAGVSAAVHPVAVDRTAAAAAVTAAIDELARVAAEQAGGDARQRGHLALHYLGQLQRLSGQPAVAVDTLQQARAVAQASPRRVETAELLIDLVLAHLDAGNVAAAAPVLDEADALLAAARAEPLPASADLAMARARIAHAEGRRTDAAAFARIADGYWRTARAAGRDAGVAAYWRARILADDGQPAGTLWRDAVQGLSMSAFAADAPLRRQATQAAQAVPAAQVPGAVGSVLPPPSARAGPLPPRMSRRRSSLGGRHTRLQAARSPFAGSTVG